MENMINQLQRKNIKLILISFFLIIINSINLHGDDNLQELIDYWGQSPEWKAILQLNDDGKPKYSHFTYFQSTEKINSVNELTKTIENANSVNIKKFPGRYYFIEKKLKIPNLVSANEDLKPIADGIKSDSISLIFASASMGAPMSYFGHTMLKFTRNESPHFSQVLSFTVEIPDSVGTVELISSGINGGFLGEYNFTPYYMAMEKYLISEQRYLIEYTLELTDYQRELIEYYAIELMQNEYSYKFFTQNCTTELTPLLQAAYPEVVKSDFFLTPYGLVETLSNADKVEGGETHEPLINEILNDLSTLSKEEKSLYRSLRKSELDEESPKLKDVDIDKIYRIYWNTQELLFKKFKYSSSEYYKARSHVFSSEKDTKSSNFSPLVGIGRIGVGTTKSDDDYTQDFYINPLYYNRYLDKTEEYAESTLEFLSMHISANYPSLTTAELTLLKMVSLNHFKRYMPLPSYRMESKLTYEQDEWDFRNSISLGLAGGNRNITLFLLPQLNTYTNPLDLSLSIYSGLSMDLGNITLGIDSNYHYFSIDSNKDVEADAYFNINIGRKVDLLINYAIPDSEASLILWTRL